MNHDEWQAQVVELATILGWRHLHVRKSIGKGRRWTTTTNRVGWPDLYLWHPRHGFAAIELKVGRDNPTVEQLQVLDELRNAGARVLVAYPWDFGQVEQLLRAATPSPDARDHRIASLDAEVERCRREHTGLARRNGELNAANLQLAHCLQQAGVIA
jgi:hypothetical protein